ncbi:class I SAM-dependent methyltransferase [Rudaea sp.]|uniref:class I SAM-dependent DNA methyltransferase n=1 Tax=Rudaea sp. TaxID=2136325 RepID=UPI002ED31C8C
MTKIYDRAYFDRWYRHSQHAVNNPALLERKAALAIAGAEYYLGQRVRNVLDVGCGEGTWRAPLRKLRPRIDYLGIDSSEYAIARYGRARNLRLVGFGQLAELRFGHDFDLIVCSDVIHYLPSAELHRGLAGIADMLAGVAFLELFTSKDALDGDKHGFIARSPKWYLSTFAQAGLTACGSHCYLGPKLEASVAALEIASNQR